MYGENLESYISKSSYWEKKSTVLQTQANTEIKWVFAENKDMKCVICMFEGKYIITTKSSHMNIMNHIEGKKTMSADWYNRKESRTEIAVDRILNMIF